MPNRSAYAPERVETAGNERTKARRIDKNFDDIFGVATNIDKRLAVVEKAIAGLGPISISGILALIQKVEDESREFALMVGYE
jgi:hypothetical protein